MTEITFPWFKQVVIDRVASELSQYGYQLLVTNESQEVEPEYLAVEFQKKLLPDIHCEIGIQLLKRFVRSKCEFQIQLDRRRQSTATQNDESETEYAYLKLDLRNVLDINGINPFPEGVFFWSFTDEESLAKGLSEALPLLVKYGIPWLEDPLSNMDSI